MILKKDEKVVMKRRAINRPMSGVCASILVPSRGYGHSGGEII
jgi:hypothetical protein